MEQNRDWKWSTLDLIKTEIHNFQHQRLGENSSCDNGCVGNILAEKLLKILENEEEKERKGTRTSIRTTPEQKAMSNSLVLREIMSFTDVRSLLNFRQVSRQWKTEATFQLLRRQLAERRKDEEFICVKFTAMARDNNFGHKSGKNLEDFLEECAKNRQMFIYSGFIFEGGHYTMEQDPILTRLFSEHGSRIQHLKLSLEHLGVARVEEILAKWTPNLKSFTFDALNWWENSSSSSNSNSNQLERGPRLFLPKLTRLTLPKTRPENRLQSLIFKILTSTPNLTSIEDPNLAHVTQITSAKNLHLVKSLSWSLFFSTEYLVNFLQFVSARPKLTSLTLQDFRHPLDSQPDARILPALFSLLELGQNTLEKVKGLEILGHHQKFDRFRFPPFPKLTQVHVSADGLFPSSTILPQGHDLSKIVPNLKALFVTSATSEIYPFTSYLNAHGSLEKLNVSISAFKLTREHLGGWVGQLGGLYPNVKNLDISIRYRGEENISECLRLIPRYFKQLERLVIRTCVFKNPNPFNPMESKWNMDQALTGFSKDVCDTLRGKDEFDPLFQFQNAEVTSQFSRDPSILDLKKLTDLTFEVQCKGNVPTFWSHVAQFYAFQPMSKRQGLEVNVRGFYTNRIPLTGNDLGSL